MIIKICGVRTLEDAECVIAAGADYIGFIFVKKSPRYLEPTVAAQIAKAVRGRIETVGVFVDEALHVVREIVRTCQLDHVQLHGHESVADIAEFAEFSLIKALALDEPEDVAKAQVYPCRLLADAIQGSQAGAGITGDWALAADLASQREILLAGGLTADTVADAILAVKPWGVDVSSGVERAKGVKDHGEIYRFVAAARQAGEDR